MKKSALTYEERLLLQRHHDGERAEEERVDAEALLAGSEQARAYRAHLDEVHVAAVAAEQEIWESSEAFEVDALISGLDEQGAEVELFDLMPLLERYHDAEVSDAERAEVERLLEEREDAAAYLLTLQELQAGFAAGSDGALDAVNFGGFWEGIEARLGEEEAEEVAAPEVIDLGKERRARSAERPAFDSEDHQVLLYRFHDGEVSEEERAQVMAWSESDDSVAATLETLDELSLGVKVAMEQAQERVDLSQIWAGVEDEISKDSPDVISLDRRREEKAASSWGRRREALIAIAAVVCTIIGVGLFKDSLFGPGEQVIVEKKYVVIVDSVEYGDGTSVMVTGPMQPAAMELDTDTIEAVDAQEPETPTVIWLIDPEEELEDPAEEPSSGESDTEPSSGDEPDAGADTKLGQPI